MRGIVSSFWRVRIVRYAFVGGIGIPVNILAYAFFRFLFGVGITRVTMHHGIDWRDAFASACAFEISTTINFVLNQLVTYSEQRHIHGWAWVKRGLQAQAASLTGLLLAYLIASGAKYEFHINPYAAQVVGIVGAFFYNFLVTNRFVFRPPPVASLTGVPE